MRTSFVKLVAARGQNGHSEMQSPRGQRQSSAASLCYGKMPDKLRKNHLSQIDTQLPGDKDKNAPGPESTKSHVLCSCLVQRLMSDDDTCYIPQNMEFGARGLHSSWRHVCFKS